VWYFPLMWIQNGHTFFHFSVFLQNLNPLIYFPLWGKSIPLGDQHFIYEYKLFFFFSFELLGLQFHDIFRVNPPEATTEKKKTVFKTTLPTINQTIWWHSCAYKYLIISDIVPLCCTFVHCLHCTVRLNTVTKFYQCLRIWFEFINTVKRRMGVMILPFFLPGYGNRGLNVDPQKRKPCRIQEVTLNTTLVALFGAF
jgi:hypothetical protein